MKKIAALLLICGVSFTVPQFLDGAAKTPINFAKIKKAVSMLIESEVLSRKGQSVKSRRLQKKAYAQFDSVFRLNKIILGTKNCSFKKLGNSPTSAMDGNRIFTLSCSKNHLGKNVHIYFHFVTKGDSGTFLTKPRYFTSAKIVEKFEDNSPEFSEKFIGKIKLTNYSNFRKPYHVDHLSGSHIKSLTSIHVGCKILSFFPMKEQY